MYFKSICLNKFLLFLFSFFPLLSPRKVSSLNARWHRAHRSVRSLATLRIANESAILGFVEDSKASTTKVWYHRSPPLSSQGSLFTLVCVSLSVSFLCLPPPTLPELWQDWCAMGVDSHQVRKHNRIQVCGFGSETI